MIKQLIPYILASELEKSFNSEFNHEDFISIIEAFQATGGEKSQRRALETFKKLPREEVIDRARTIVKLNYLLKNIKSNALSSTSAK